MTINLQKTSISVLLASALVACGGGGGSDSVELGSGSTSPSGSDNFTLADFDGIYLNEETYQLVLIDNEQDYYQSIMQNYLDSTSEDPRSIDTANGLELTNKTASTSQATTWEQGVNESQTTSVDITLSDDKNTLSYNGVAGFKRQPDSLPMEGLYIARTKDNTNSIWVINKDGTFNINLLGAVDLSHRQPNYCTR